MQTLKQAEPEFKKVFREFCTVLHNNEAEKRQAPTFTVAKIDGASLSESII